MSIHSDAAQARLEEIRAMRQQIPNFVIPVNPGERRKLARAAAVSPQFIELTTVLVKNSPALARGGGLDPAQLRDLMSFAEAYEPLADELEALAHFVRHSAVAAKNRAGNEALTTYALAQRLAKQPSTAELAPHVDDMRRALRAKTGRKAKGQSGPTPPNGQATPAPPPMTAPSTAGAPKPS